MTLSLLLPLGLAALAALLLPLLVHLARRSEEHVVVFAALRWLQARPQPRRKRRFEEHLLLLVRLLMLAALAVLLAEPVLFGKPDLTPRVVVAPGVDIDAASRGIDRDAAHWQWLAPGFPAIAADARAPATAVRAPFASLLRELDATLPAGAPLMVLVPAIIDGADAERPQLSRRVDWRIVASSPTPTRTPVNAMSMPMPMPMPALMVRHAPERAASLRYLRAAGVAWQLAAAKPSRATANSASPVGIADVSTALDAGVRNLVWLSPGPVPAAVRDWISAGGSALLDAQAVMPALDTAPVVWRDEHGPLARGMRLGRGRVMRLERDLLPAAMPGLLEPDFPTQLQQVFSGAALVPTRVDASAYAPRVGATPYPESPRPLAPWLAALIAVLFVVERWLANGPRRRSAA